MTYVIALPCVDVKDRACIDECPVDCIYEGNRMLYIHPEECVDCGACEPVCPVEAIYYEDDVPEQWKDYYKANVEFFEEIGSPGGAAKVGVIAGDHTVVAALPPQVAEATERVEASTIDHIVVLLVDGRSIVWGNADNSAEKTAVLPALLAMSGTVLDVSVPSHPAIR